VCGRRTRISTVPALKIIRAAPSRARRRTSNVVTGLGAERRCALFRLDRTTDDLDDGNPQLDDSFMDRFWKWSAIAGSASRKERRAV